jgi:hypothetical protein
VIGRPAHPTSAVRIERQLRAPKTELYRKVRLCVPHRRRISLIDRDLLWTALPLRQPSNRVAKRARNPLKWAKMNGSRGRNLPARIAEVRSCVELHAMVLGYLKLPAPAARA